VITLLSPVVIHLQRDQHKDDRFHKLFDPIVLSLAEDDYKLIPSPIVNGNEKCTRNGKIKMYHPAVH
jgi:hypothetical protein